MFPLCLSLLSMTLPKPSQTTKVDANTSLTINLFPTKIDVWIPNMYLSSNLGDEKNINVMRIQRRPKGYD